MGGLWWETQGNEGKTLAAGPRGGTLIGVAGGGDDALNSVSSRGGRRGVY